MRSRLIGTALALVLLSLLARRELGAGGDLAAAAAAGPPPRVPTEGRPGGYVTSAACRACHPDEHASWHRTFHRTMTQYAAPGAVLGRFDGVSLPVKRGEIRLERRESEYWVRGLIGGDQQERQIGLLTGSHHMQAYWMTGRPGNTLEMLPYVFLTADRRWVPARDVFLADPEQPWTSARWNDQCLQCHVTAGQPRPGPGDDEMQTRAAELAIACESCHGPGERHVQAQRAAATRGGARPDRDDPTIVNPRRLSARLSTHVCSQCHSIKAVLDQDAFLREGFSYRPGDDLERTRPFLLPGKPGTEPLLRRLEAAEPGWVAGRFWSDGMVRVSGREGLGLARTACHLRGEMSCLTCHSMHDYVDRSDQLARGKEGNEACLGCHQTLRTRLVQHTRHAPGSPGSQCQNCHMPHTTYGLLKAIRSHEIDSPSVRTSVAVGRPNACNLCHLDRPLAWAAEHLTRWYRAAPVALGPDERKVAAGVMYLLRGDAGQRALAAWHMGWEPARQASGAEWMPRFLVLALGDPYAAVRYIAQRSLRRTPELAEVQYDYVAPPEEIERSVERIARQWRGLRGPVPARKANRLLLNADGSLQRQRILDVLRRRDERSVDLKE